MADSVEEIVTRVINLAARRGWELTTASREVFGHTNRMKQLMSGQSYLRPPTRAKALARILELEAETSPRPPPGASGGGQRRAPRKRRPAADKQGCSAAAF